MNNFLVLRRSLPHNAAVDHPGETATRQHHVSTSQGRRGWLFAQLLVALALIAGVGGLLQPRFVAILTALLAGLYVSQMLACAFHELAHAAVAYVVGFRVERIAIGRYAAWKGVFLGIPFELGLAPFDGVVVAVPRSCAALRTRWTAVSAAGPLANAGLALVALPFVFGANSILVLALTQLFVVTNLFAMVISLAPQRVELRDSGQWSDGTTILVCLFGSAPLVDRLALLALVERSRACFTRGDYAGACADAERLYAAYPSHAAAVLLAPLRVQAGDFQGAAELCRSRLGRADLEESHRRDMLNCLAYADLLSGQPELLVEADRCSAEAYSGASSDVHIVETRASTLVALGRVVEGIALLQWVLEQELDDRNRASAECSLAIGLAQLGDVDGARSALESARIKGPHLVLLARAEASCSTSP